ncbi:sodium-independent sulfate anion transporter isoform X7 [Apus apus]|uniref:sodium-independent sulfate anion transporter isoform X7 n=1 Tax=Apus apus TaxID=8895 RepID=UPI0021F8308C|nr:sodium-independent sulfate anion transporter isoform X7 [Apus apus]
MPGPRQCCPCPGGWRWLPALRWLPRYSLAWLQLDLMAGLTVGLTVVPQALAYAEVAGLPLQYGLYSSFTGCFVYCFLGTAKDVTLGPTAIMSLLVSSYAFHEPVYAVLLAFLSGCIQLAMGLLHLGFLLDFISCPVIKGFTSAASITISFNQVKNILGLQGIPRQFFLQVYETLRRIGETRAGDAVLGLACLAALAGLQAMKSRLPRAAGAEPLAARVSYLIVWTTATGALATPCSLPSRGCPCWGPVSLGQGRDSLKLVKTRSAGAETWRWVTEDQVPRLVLPLYMSLPKAWKSSAARIPTSCCPSCCSGLQACFHGCSLCCSTQRPGGPVCWPGCLLLPGDGLPATDTHRQHPPGPPGLPAAALLHGCTQRHRPLPEHGGASQNSYRIDPNQELLALGFANILGSFVSSYPITGSFGRTAVNAQSGVCTPAGGLVTEQRWPLSSSRLWSPCLTLRSSGRCGGLRVRAPPGTVDLPVQPALPAAGAVPEGPVTRGQGAPEPGSHLL